MSTPSDAQRELLELERAMFAALRTRDAERLRHLLAEDFSLRVAGEAPVGREAFITAVQGIPGEILEVGSDELHAQVIDGVGILTGRQRARVRLPDGTEALDVGVFTDVCARREGRWQIVLAHTVTLPGAK